MPPEKAAAVERALLAGELDLLYVAPERLVTPGFRQMLQGVDFKDDPYAVATGADVLVIITEWDQFRALDLDRIKLLMNKPVLVDLRNIYKPDDLRARGFAYTSIGRA